MANKNALSFVFADFLVTLIIYIVKTSLSIINICMHFYIKALSTVLLFKHLMSRLE
jgi:hypothetical protein